MTITLNLTTEEARNLAGLIDIALKHPTLGGLQIALPATALVQRLEHAQRDAQAREPAPQS